MNPQNKILSKRKQVKNYREWYYLWKLKQRKHTHTCTCNYVCMLNSLFLQWIHFMGLFWNIGIGERNGTLRTQLTSVIPRMVHEPRASASPGNLRDIQILGPCPSTLNQDTQAGAQQSVLTSHPVDSGIHPALKNCHNFFSNGEQLNVSKQFPHSPNSSHMWLLQSPWEMHIGGFQKTTMRKVGIQSRDFSSWCN